MAVAALSCIMQKKRALAIKQEWGDRPCEHPALAREYDLGKRTGAYVCTQCGTTFTFREKAEMFGVRAPEPERSQPGGFMKKKSVRDIPDFSRKASHPKAGGVPNALPSSKVRAGNATAPRPKPQASSSKSGQRGK